MAMAGKVYTRENTAWMGAKKGHWISSNTPANTLPQVFCRNEITLDG
jgi:hypothetical protein